MHSEGLRTIYILSEYHKVAPPPRRIRVNNLCKVIIYTKFPTITLGVTSSAKGLIWNPGPKADYQYFYRTVILQSIIPTEM